MPATAPLGHDIQNLPAKRKRGSRAKKRHRLINADPAGWNVHSPFHWSIWVEGHQLHYWPSTCAWRYRGVTHKGDPISFISARCPEWQQ